MEAAAIAQQFLQAAELEGASVTVLQPASGEDGFAGARLQLTLPEAALEAALRKTAEKMAEEQGAKLQELHLTLQPLEARARAVRVEVRGTARMLMSTLSSRLTGELVAPTPRHVVLQNLQFDPGKGMFASMASAFLTPRLRQWEGSLHDFSELLQCALEIETLRVEPTPGGQVLQIVLCGATPSGPPSLP
jgi:hypothetical protein